jgi:periplasmic protein TonB
MAYRSVDRASRWKAMLASFALTGILGAVLVSGLNVETVRHAIEHLRTFDISLPKPPPPEPPPPPKPREAKKAEGAPAAPKASPIVAPKPEVVLPTRQVIAAAAKAGTGASSSNGQGGVGNGTGAGGTGNGLGGGGGAGNTPARLIRNLTRADYGALTGGRLSAGSAGLGIRVAANGRVDSCRVEHSSGDSVIDSGLCPLVQSRLLFAPARNANGQPIAYFTHYLARWRR